MSSEMFSRRSLLAGAAIAASQMGAAVLAAQSSNPLDWTLTEAADALAKRAVSSEELTRLCFARIHKLDPALNAFITLQEESALAQARECDGQRKLGHSPGRLYGVPIALKDNIDTAGVRTTAAANVFKNRIPAGKMRKSPDDCEPPGRFFSAN